VNTKLQRHFDKLEKERFSLMQRVKSLSPEQFQSAPPGKWSVSHILAHLIAAEQLSVQYMSKKILGIHEAENSGLWEECKSKLLTISQRLPFKFKAPGRVVELTKAQMTFEDIEHLWSHERALLKELLEKIHDDHIRKKIYKHVRAGQLNIQQALIFFRDHIIHHKPQIKRLL
jgi:uncharacterized damage-inducible protein DinB